MSPNLAKFAAQAIIQSGLLPAIERLEHQRDNVLRILAYHRIGDSEAENGRLDPTLLSATPRMFARQMEFLVDTYHIVSVEEVLSAVVGGRPLPPRSVMITFDDGYQDFLDVAWPVLERLQIPAVLFVATEYLSKPDRLFWWDELYQVFSQTECNRLRLSSVGHYSLESPEQRTRALLEVKDCVERMEHHQAMALVDELAQVLEVCPRRDRLILSWQEVRYLSSRGLHIGAHTRSHPILSRLSPDKARQEIVGCQQDLARQLGRTWPIFAYPCGGSTHLCPTLVTILHETGIKLAMTTIMGHNRLGHTDPLRLKRACLAPHLSMPEFRLVLTGILNVYGMLWEAGRTRR
jgi:peptidoglycan/xylan/chitin deacetylase (PgdA/CDA1 family)